MLKFTKQIALEAGEIVKKYYFGKDLKIEHKSEKDLVTEADKACEKFLIEEILKEFPTHGILGEEGGSKESSEEFEYKWIIDPIDGTTNFAHKIPMFAISIGVEKKGEIVIGVVYNPITGELFSAEKGQGATLEILSHTGEILSKKTLSVSKTDTLSKALLATGFHPGYPEIMKQNFKHFERLQLSSQTIRRLGAASIDLAYTADGRFDGYWEMKLKPWDMAAGILLVKEAGGIVSSTDGSDFDLYGDTILATNKHLHKTLVDELEKDR